MGLQADVVGVAIVQECPQLARPVEIAMSDCRPLSKTGGRVEHGRVFGMDVSDPRLGGFIARAEVMATGDEVVGGVPDHTDSGMVDGSQNRRRVAPRVTEAAADVFDAEYEPKIGSAARGVDEDRAYDIQPVSGQLTAVRKPQARVLATAVEPTGKEPNAGTTDGDGGVHGGLEKVHVLAPAGCRFDGCGTSLADPQRLECRRQDHRGLDPGVLQRVPGTGTQLLIRSLESHTPE